MARQKAEPGVQSVSKALKKACKKQAKKWFKQQLQQSGKTSKSTRQFLKRRRKQLACSLWASLQGTLQSGKIPEKKQLKHQLKALASQNAANDARILAPVQFIRAAVVKVAPHSAMTPYKRKPCSGCPALKGKLCKCALKVEARKLRQQKAD